MKFRFLSLASGSSGNCYYLGTEEYGILLDAGIGIKTIRKTLRNEGIGIEDILAVFVTHDHADHIKSVGCLGEKYHIPIYATLKVHEGIEKSRYVEEKLYASKKIIEAGVPVRIRDYTLTAFEVPHDARDCVGYKIEFGGRVFVLATDVGHITETVASNIRAANYLVMETNYDPEMLEQGTYPSFLKKRIVGENGHLSNNEAADFLAENFDLKLKDVWLCHLSKDNNHPELALKTVERAMGNFGIKVGKDVQVVPLKRLHPSEMYYFDV